MSWYEKLLPKRIRVNTDSSKRKIPEGVWEKCKNCGTVLYREEISNNQYVCTNCDYHMRIGARERLNIFLDQDSQVEINTKLTSKDFLKFKDSKKYKDRISESQDSSNELDALITSKGMLYGVPVVVAAFEFSFMGGSMGSVVGEKFVQGINKAIKHKTPFICFATSGGARMQESMISLMQMAKTSAAIQKLKKEKLPYISVLVDPIYGGVSASIAMLGDINIAEPNALSGFTGRRVIEQTVRIELPDNFQKSEYLLSNGAIDMIVHRNNLRSKISGLLKKIHK